MGNIKSKIIMPLMFAAICPTALNATVKKSENHPDSVYLLSYATPSNPKEGIRLAYSIDQKNWIGIGNNHSFVRSDFGTWGAEKNMFSPSVIQDTDGTWYAVWSLNQRSPQFATTLTHDLWIWKPQDYPFMAKGKNVISPVITKENGKFVVTYKTTEGEVYRTESSDFKQWSVPEKTSENNYKSKLTQAIVNGIEREGEVNRVAWQTVEKLITNVEAAAFRAQRDNERMADDEWRFKGLKEVKASLNVNLNDTKAISSDLIGIFFEDINYAADGGLYAELIQNRDFEYSKSDRGEWNSQTSWTLQGEGSEWTIETENPIHANNSHYSVLNTTKTGAQLINSGFDGIVTKKGEKYILSLFLRSLSKNGQKLRVSIKNGSEIIATSTFSASSAWKQYKTTLTAKSDADNATLCIEPLSEGKVGIDFVSLFPQNTYKKRTNGMRADLAQLLADIHPRFVRFPGGCATHGNGIDNIYHWKNTIGPLHERKGNFNIWGYHQSMGLGFYEYFQFCEDIGAEPLPVLAAGVPCQNSSRGGDGQQGGIPMDEMDEYLQELLDLIEWANGDAKTSSLARLRAEAGHPKPFNLKYLGIGNEDLISDVFTERYNYLCRGIRAKHPEITVVGTVGPFFEGSDYEYGWQIAKEEKLPIVDEHYYNSPGWFINNQKFYDKYERNSTKVYLGEYASRGNNLENALAEGVHITNLERNGDVVVMSSYAPLLAKEKHTQWNPDLIYFNNTEVKPTVNYYIQQLCGQNSGSQYIYNNLNVEDNNEAVFKRVASSVVKDEKTGDLILKLVNCLPSSVKLDINLGSIEGYQKAASKTVITGNYNERNLKPTVSSIEVSDKFDYELPKYSFTVIRIKHDTAKK